MIFRNQIIKLLKRYAPRLTHEIKNNFLVTNETQIPVNVQANGTIIDSFVVERSGILSITGWQHDFNALPSLGLFIDDASIEINEAHRIYRPDIANHLKVSNYFLGYSIEFLTNRDLNDSVVEIQLDGNVIWRHQIKQSVVTPHYGNFLTERNVQHRENVYGYGPPTKIVSNEVLALVETFTDGVGRVLDFGCGRGNLVAHLRKKGIDITGIEIDTSMIRESILPECNEHIHLYNGELPLPFKDNEFDCTIAIEVIEHIENYPQVLAEISRISKRNFLMTVPDITAIPRCFPQSVIPWHLLESTHVNFFTEKSLRNVLSSWWNQITILKIGHVRVNDSRYATSVAAYCEKTKTK